MLVMKLYQHDLQVVNLDRLLKLKTT